MTTLETPARIMETKLHIGNILVFDSGAGGLTVTREILAQSPGCELTYLADNGGFPYGVMDDDQLIERIVSVISRAITQTTPDMVVIACNTASTLALAALRNQHPSIEFVGVVPAIKPAVSRSRSRVIGLLATPATINRPYTDMLIAEFAQGARIVKYGSNKLVCFAEACLHGNSDDSSVLHREIDHLIQMPNANGMDTVVLACTHFPIFKQRLEQLEAYQHIAWIDSGQAIANRVSYLIKKLHLRLSTTTTINFLFTGTPTPVDTLDHFRKFLGLSAQKLSPVRLLQY